MDAHPPSSIDQSVNPATHQYDGVQIYKRLLRYSLDHWGWLSLAIIGLIISATTQPLFAAMMQPLLDGTFMEKDPDTILWMPAVILMIFSVRGISNFLSGYFMGKIGRTVIMKLRGELFEQLLHVPIRYYDTHPKGQLLAKLTYHVEQLATASTKCLTVLVQDIAIIIGLLALMLYHSWQLTLGMFIIAPVITFLVLYVTKRFRKLSRRLQDSVGDINQIADECIHGQREVRIFNGLDYERQRYQVANDDNLLLHIKRLLTEQTSTPLIQFMVAIALAIIIFIATQESVIDTLTPGRFMSFVMAMVFLLTPIRRLSQINAPLQQGIAAGQSIFSLLDEAREINQGTHRIDRAKGYFSFENVTFSYDSPQHNTDNTSSDADETKSNQDNVIHSLSLQVASGETIALVGKSGSGKTTLVNLLPRFYDYQSGCIKLDGIALPDIELNNLRAQFAYVGQHVTLFNDTVRNNIAYGSQHNQDMATITQAAQSAHALEFIEKLPNGFDTEIGDNGVLLSGGQRQRIAIARAILADAPILILDEATSALDTESERHIQSALDTLIQNRTTFIIAHRLSTIENADRILVMEQGKIIESGNHHDLLAKKGMYAKLYEMQFHDS